MIRLILLLLVFSFGCSKKAIPPSSNEGNLTIKQHLNIRASLKKFEKTESDREIFIQEMINLDSLLQFDDYLDRVLELKTKKLKISVNDGIVKLDFIQLFCVDYDKLKNENRIPNVENLRSRRKLTIYCRNIASDLDIFPRRTGSLTQDCIVYLKAIEQIVNEHERILGINFTDYKEIEAERNITSESKKFIFRKRFIKFLNEKYHVGIE